MDKDNMEEVIDEILEEIEVIKLPHSRLYGIDYGGAYTCVSEWMGDDRPLEDVKFPKCKDKRFPSTICYLPKFNEWVIGDLAEGCVEKYPNTSFTNLKRRVGENVTLFNQDEEEISCEEALRNFFRILKDFFQEVISDEEKIESTVVAVPYCFYEYQRATVMKALKNTGLPVMGLINEPDAIILAYCFEDRIVKQEENILIIDMGETSLDIALYEVRQKRKYIIINCLNIMGSPSIGGGDLDRVLLKKILEKHSLKESELWKEIFKNKQSIAGKLRASLKELKHKLSTKQEESLLNIQLIPGETLYQGIRQDEFNEWIEPVLHRINEYLNNILNEVNMSYEKIDRILVNGRSTRIPAIKNLIEKVFPQTDKILFLNNDYLVSQGAAIYAAILKGKTERFGLNPINPYAIGVELKEGIFDDIIIKGKRLPCGDKKAYKLNTTVATAFDLMIYQGNEKIVDKNQLILPVEM